MVCGEVVRRNEKREKKMSDIETIIKEIKRKSGVAHAQNNDKAIWAMGKTHFVVAKMNKIESMRTPISKWTEVVARVFKESENGTLKATSEIFFPQADQLKALGRKPILAFDRREWAMLPSEISEVLIEDEHFYPSILHIAEKLEWSSKWMASRFPDCISKKIFEKEIFFSFKKKTLKAFLFSYDATIRKDVEYSMEIPIVEVPWITHYATPIRAVETVIDALSRRQQARSIMMIVYKEKKRVDETLNRFKNELNGISALAETSFYPYIDATQEETGTSPIPLLPFKFCTDDFDLFQKALTILDVQRYDINRLLSV